MARKGQGSRSAPAGAEATRAAPWLTGWTALGIYFGLAVVYFLPAFLPGRHIYGTDYLAGTYFAHDFISQRFADGFLPKWTPFIYGGLPMFANPGSTFYPFRFLADLVFPTSRIFPALYVIQFTLAGLGAYLLGRELGARRWVAFLGGLAFQFTGLTMSFVLAGHEGRLIVASFAPLFLFFIHRGVRTGRLAWFAGMGLVVGFSLLSFQIQSNYYLLLAGAAWAAFVLVRERGRLPSRALATRTGLGLAAVALGFAMAAVNFLPFADYVDASPRGGPGRGYEYATSWSMPPAEITAVALPEHAGVLELYQGENPFKLHTEYVGAVVLLLMLVGLWISRRDPRWWFFALLALFALSISFGGHTPLYRLYYELLPGTRRFRAPSISFFLVSLSLVVLATLALERLAALVDGATRGRSPAPSGGSGATGAHPDQDRDALQRVPWILGGASALALVVLLAAAGQTGDPRGDALARGAFRLALATWTAAGVIWAWLRGSVAAPVAAVVLAAVVVVDLWIVDRRFFDTVEPPAAMFAADGIVHGLADEPGPFRVWVLPFPIAGSPPYRNHGNYLMHHGIQQAGGEHGNHIQRYGEYVGAGQATYVDWHNLLTDLQRLIDAAPGAPVQASFLRGANIRYVVSTVGLPGLTALYQGREGAVYEVPAALPRAWLAAEAVVAEQPDGALEVFRQPDFDPGRTAVLYEPLPTPLPETPLEGAAEVTEYEPDRVRIAARASRPAVLVLADNFYDGWTATIDGAATPVLRVNHTFRGVVVPEGAHEVEFTFRPPRLYAGLWISALATLLLVAGFAAAPLSRRRARG